ncbi:MAG: tyrosine-protein phosphatase [Pseudomonadota bacterium]
MMITQGMTWIGRIDTLDPRRHIPLGSIQNLRDLGGYSTTDGGTTRWKTFLRYAGMSALTNTDRQQMLDYEIRAVVDLRSLQDIKDAPNPFADLDAVAYHHLDLWGDRVSDFKSSTSSLTQQAKLAIDVFLLIFRPGRWLSARCQHSKHRDFTGRVP